ncbi:MAG TPA: formyl transferase [archaeon]|nr:formyl transferase [archaeon]
MTDLLITCGSKLRHLYFAGRLAETFPNSAIIIEADEGESSKNYNAAPTEKMQKHFKEFDKIEKTFFENFVNDKKKLIEEKTIAKIKKGEINSPETSELIKKSNPKFIAVYSTSLIKPELFDAFPRRWINLHAGLSPYYRGSGTNIYPILNKEPEYIGMTIHHIAKGIDDGNIILQGRPKIEETDNVHTIGCKCAVLGTDLMIKVMRKLFKGEKCPDIRQNKKLGRLYLRKEFTDETIDEINRLTENGLMTEYAKNPKKISIAEW